MYGGFATIRSNGCASTTRDNGSNKIAHLNRHAVREIELVDVPLRDDDGGGAGVGGQHCCRLQMRRDRRRDAAAAGAQVQHARRLHSGFVSGQLQNILDDGFGIGTRDQDIARHFEFKVKKVRLAGEISDRLILAGAFAPTRETR